MTRKEIMAQRIRKCRTDRGLTQREAAIYCDITERAFQNYELMNREPKVEILVRIAEFFQVSLDYLAGLTDDLRPYPRPEGED